MGTHSWPWESQNSAMAGAQSPTWQVSWQLSCSKSRKAPKFSIEILADIWLDIHQHMLLAGRLA